MDMPVPVVQRRIKHLDVLGITGAQRRSLNNQCSAEIPVEAQGISQRQTRGQGTSSPIRAAPRVRETRTGGRAAAPFLQQSRGITKRRRHSAPSALHARAPTFRRQLRYSRSNAATVSTTRRAKAGRGRCLQLYLSPVLAPCPSRRRLRRPERGTTTSSASRRYLQLVSES